MAALTIRSMTACLAILALSSTFDATARADTPGPEGLVGSTTAALELAPRRIIRRGPPPKHVRGSRRDGSDGSWTFKAMGRGAVVEDGPTEAVGLAGFRFWLKGGEQQLRRLGLMRSHGNSVRATFADDDREELFEVTAKYQALPKGTRLLQASRDGCTGSCSVSIARPKGNEAFVLRGFFVGRRGGDTNLRELSIDPRPDAGKVEVVFADNGSPDFNVVLQYAYVADSWVARTHEVTFQRQFEGPASPTSRSILQGFSIQFTNGDHRVEHLALQRGGERYTGRITDGNGDDPWKIRVRYLQLRTQPFLPGKTPLPKSKPLGPVPTLEL